VAASLEGKVIVVIGGTTGLGLSAAKAFVRTGARVVVVGRSAESGVAAERALGKSGRLLIADASRSATAPAAIEKAMLEFGGFDGLYHVAGGSGRKWGDGPLHEITDEGWERTFELNLTSLFYSNRAAAQHFLKQQRGGSVLNMSSVLAFSPSPKYFSTHAYATAKAGIIGLSKAAAAYYAPANIRFNVLAPGLVATPMSQRAQDDGTVLRFVASKQPLDGGRIGQASDLDAAAVYFMSDESRFVTGQVLSVDGGWSVSEGLLSVPTAKQAPASPKSFWTRMGEWWATPKKRS
jgi:NAD(P)-dependent dehydrogenase (short-subunit alcohol dehydrogenase family)